MTDKNQPDNIKVPWRGQTINNALLVKATKRIVTGALSVTLAVGLTGTALADQLDDQIAALRQDVAGQQEQAANLRRQADTLANKLAGIHAQSVALQTQINLNQAKSNKVNNSIAQNKAKLEQQKIVLSANIKSTYVDGSVTPIEMLASSKNFSDFLDQQQYQDKIKNKIQSAMTEVQTLQATLETEQTQLTQLLSDQKGQKQQLAILQQETNELLASTRGQEAAYSAQAKENNTKIADLKAQQAAILAARFAGTGISSVGACGGGYPAKWCNAGQDTLVDNWGMYNRECVSYTAFKVWQSGRHMPYWGGVGNAKQWPGNASAAGIPVDDNPRAGDVAITTLGQYGHAMYVEAVLSGGRIRVSQYNYGNRGEYSEMTIPSSSLYFIHFR